MKRFSFQEMKDFWRIHSARWAGIDYERDPDGLTNVCHPGAPLWFNRYYDRIQRAAFSRLLSLVPPASSGSSALDIGCGAGRWSRLLSGRGFSVVGIDLQPDLVEANRKRHPGIEFKCVSIQEFESAAGFDLVSSVTVLQHNPHPEQEAAIIRIRSMLKMGGHVLILEDMGEDAPGVFARDMAGWKAVFERAGYACLAVRPYNYSPFIRLHWRLAGALRILIKGRDIEGKEPTPENYLAPEGGTGRGRSLLRFMNDAARLAAVALDTAAEPVLAAVFPGGGGPAAATQCGFLFKGI